MKRVLIVDDDQATRCTLKQMLVHYGDCTEADNGLAALSLWSAALKTQPFHVVIMDLLMPTLNGLDALYLIRSTESRLGVSFFDQVKILMVTVKGDRPTIFEAFRKQCDGYLVKPITQDGLLHKLRELEHADGPQFPPGFTG